MVQCLRQRPWQELECMSHEECKLRHEGRARHREMYRRVLIRRANILLPVAVCQSHFIVTDSIPARPITQHQRE